MKERIKAFDGLRGLCCVPVVFCHYWGAALALNDKNEISQLPFSNIFNIFYNKGQLFVYLFFWLSGFAISAKYKDKMEDLTYTDFIRRRFKKLYPCVFVSITIGILLSFIDSNFTNGICTRKPIELYKIVMSYTLLLNGWCDSSSDSPYGSGLWFICVLLFCYTFFYLIVKICKKYYLLFAVSLFLIGFSINVSNISYVIPFTGSVSFAQGVGLVGFFGGVLLYEMIYGQLQIRVKFSQLEEQVLLFLLTMFVLYFVLKEGVTQRNMLLFYSPAVIILALKARWLSYILELKLLQWLGKISMSIYLSHGHVINSISIILVYFGIKENYNDYIIWYITFGLCIVVGLIWYFLVENRFVSIVNSYLQKHIGE